MIYTRWSKFIGLVIIGWSYSNKEYLEEECKTKLQERSKEKEIIKSEVIKESAFKNTLVEIMNTDKTKVSTSNSIKENMPFK